MIEHCNFPVIFCELSSIDEFSEVQLRSHRATFTIHFSLHSYLSFHYSGQIQGREGTGREHTS